MSKILDATCSAAGVVTAEGYPVDDAVILSQGQAASEGVLVMEGEKATYITSNASDIHDLIGRLVTIVNQISTVLTALDGVSTTPGSAAAPIAALGVLKTELDATKDLLK